MIRAFHCIFGAYGFWLPNEPRGSWSDFVASWELYRFCEATTVHARRSLAHEAYDRDLKKRMESALKFPTVHFSPRQARMIAEGFGNTPYLIHACAVLAEHVHVVIGHTPRDIRRVIGHLKSDATRSLRSAGHFTDRSPWADHGWNVYLNSHEAVERAIRYVENNPVREGGKLQEWAFIVPYDRASAREGARGTVNGRDAPPG